MSCQCHDATIRAYQMLKDTGQREGHAYEAAVRVFRHYHPDRPSIDAYEIVADWLDTWERSGDSRGA